MTHLTTFARYPVSGNALAFATWVSAETVLFLSYLDVTLRVAIGIIGLAAAVMHLVSAFRAGRRD